MISVMASAPTRVDIAGGTIDLWPIHCLLRKKATVNFAIGLPASVELTESADGQFHLESLDLQEEVSGTLEDILELGRLPLLAKLLDALWEKKLPALTIKTSALSPAGAGLGGSSTLAVALAGALLEAKRELTGEGDLTDHELVRLCQDVEADIIKAPTGCQDYWGAVRGGLNIIRYPAGRTEVKTVRTGSFIDDLKDRTVICYSGQSRQSAINNWEIFKRVFDGDTGLLDQLQKIGELSEKTAACMLAENVVGALDASRSEWNLRQNLWPNIETEVTRQLTDAGCEAGADFSRVCGAGGGGVMSFFCSPEKKPEVEAALKEAGGHVMDAVVMPAGLRVTGNFG